VATAAGETLAVPVVSDTFRIASVLAPGDTLLADIKPLWPSPGIPTWVWVALIVAVALLAAGLWWLWRRRRRSLDAGAGVESGDPYTEARRRLEALVIDPPTPAGRIAAAGEIPPAYLARAGDARPGAHHARDPRLTLRHSV
jgi:LPXTG-motif cell wall-anchored protein